MFNIKMDTIRERTTNGPTYMKGRQYYRQGHVKHLAYDQAKGLIVAQVEGTRMYNVRIILNSKGDLHDATCTCSAFAAYWGLCRHIAAALLYCIDAFNTSKNSLHIEQSPVQKDKREKVEELSQAAVQTIRRNRSKARDFLNRMDHVCKLAQPFNKQAVSLRVILFASRNTANTPSLSFALGINNFYLVTNIEQFAEAVSRDVPLELDHHFIFDPVRHCFKKEDMPLIRMLQDAFENDYKSVFGSTSSSGKDRSFVLNPSRLAQFLLFSAQLSDCTWVSHEDDQKKIIQMKENDLPIRLILNHEMDSSNAQAPYSLHLISSEPIQQITASRNVYLVGDVFYLPPVDSIKMLEPVLSTFMKPNAKNVLLSHEEVIFLLSDIRPQLQSVCPIELGPDISAQIIEQPLQSTIDLDYANSSLKAAVIFQYGPVNINPLDEKTGIDGDGNAPLLVRDRHQEKVLLASLKAAGFSQHGLAFRISDARQVYAFLDEHLDKLRQMTQLRLSPTAAKLRIIAPPPIMFEFSMPSGQDQLGFSQDYGHLKEREIATYMKALKEKQEFYRRADGSYQKVNLNERDLRMKLLDMMQLWQVRPHSGFQQLPSYRALTLHNVMQAYPNAQGIRVSDNLRQLIEHLHEPGSLRFRTPQVLSGQLRPYQKTGFRWLCTLDYYGLGGILADDMGLGKTLQTIAFVTYIWQKYKRNVLIVAPTSLIYNWASEFERFSPQVPIAIIDGNRQQRADLLHHADSKACLITSYSLLRRDIDTLHQIKFSCCFLDEAQNIKNPDTLNAKSVKQIQADRAFALTGTPIENALSELWSIFDFIMPGYLYKRSQFQSQFEIPIMRENDQDCIRDLRQLISPFLLRRMKKDVLQELPQKIETKTICDMTEKQRQLYQEFLKRSYLDLRKELKSSGYAKSQIYILALLTRLRQICCHPGLFVSDYDGGSGKLLLLDELLADSFAAGHRVLLFSQFTSMLDIIRKRVEKQGENPLYIDGQIAAEERLNLVDRFNAGEGRLFLISLRAGGTGLNLTGADTVIHYDPWWNPAVEEQATDRVYRIGQENVVQVIKLYTRNSVEEKIQQLQERKQQLVDTMIKPGQNLLSKMSLDEVLSLFEVSE